MTTLSLDPGVTTGWAVLEDDGAVRDTGNWRPEDLKEGLEGIVLKWVPDDVVVEVFPLAASGQLATTLREVVATITEVLTDYTLAVDRVTPGVWKTSSVEPSPKAIDGEKLTPHQRDAIRMGRYHVRHKDRRNA